MQFSRIRLYSTSCRNLEGRRGRTQRSCLPRECQPPPPPAPHTPTGEWKREELLYQVTIKFLRFLRNEHSVRQVSQMHAVHACVLYLPAAEIPEMLDWPEQQSKGRLKHFTDFVRATWINNTVRPPSCWGVFEQAVPTNNSVEGWHLV